MLLKGDWNVMSMLAGLDIGSAFSKAVIVENGSIVSTSYLPTEGNFRKVAEQVLDEALDQANLTLKDIRLIGGCGLGASFIPYPYTKVTDISCQSRGVYHLAPAVRTVFEVGNQASKVIKMTAGGKVADCLVSDRCAAGSGRILQIIAKVLKVKLDELGVLSARSTQPVKFTTGCAVFLETEAISRVAEGSSIEDIVAGLHQALAARITAMAQRMRIQQEFAIAGGGAKDRGLVRAMEASLGKPLYVPDEPLITTALGAALIAAEKNGY